MPVVLVLVVLTVPLVACATKPGRRFLAGHPMDGRHRTNATFFKAPTKALDGRSDRSWWHWRPGWHRGAVRAGSLTVAIGLGCGLLFAWTATVAVLLTFGSAMAGYVAWWLFVGLRNWKRAVTWNRNRPWRSAWAALTLPVTHHLHYRVPLRAALTAELGAPPARLRLPLDRSKVIVGVPAQFTGSDQGTLAVGRAVTAKAGLESPEAAARLHGRRPAIVYTRSIPSPAYVSWEGPIEQAVASAAHNELIFGLGKRDALITATYGESPHLAIPGGSGGGKSALVAFLLLQELMRGTLVINLDPKWTSQLWLQHLPNVINAHDTPDLHLALVWLGKELKRRTRAAYYSAGGTGRVRGSVGQRIVVLAEELNYGMPDLKDYWTETRAGDKSLPKKSPAISALSGVSCAGRASDIHAWLVAQLLTVDSTGVKDSTIRTNAGIKAMMARLDKPGWDMAVGKHLPMPSPSDHPGRIHLVTGMTVRETQVPYLHLDDKDEAAADKAVAWARQMAVSGKVAQIPIGGEYGVPQQLWPAPVASVLGQIESSPGAGQDPNDIGQGTPAAVTVNEALMARIFGDRSRDAAAKLVQRAIQRGDITPVEKPRRGRESKYRPEDLRKVAGGNE